ncbi:MAG: hypothetical protein IT374_03290 [Polyangiaceae bacterium]|nr:hypothetical protein [Polyangiaceae bacterium]
MSLGVARLAPTVTASANGQSVDEKYSGTTLALDIMLGGSVARHVVLGGGVMSLNISDPDVERQGVTSDVNREIQLTMLGPFVDVYPDPHGGLHFQGLAGIASLEARNGSSRSGSALRGVGLAGGVGYDFWVSSQWSLGVMGRLHYASVDVTIDGVVNKSTMVAPALLFTALLH